MQTFNGKPLIPFINCSSKAVFSMRGELQALLTKLGLTVDDLLFQDRVLHKCATENSPVNVFLVDHNEISTSWKLTQPGYKANVMGVIDHHADAGLFMDASPRIVKVCGSNASLLLDYLYGIKETTQDQGFSERFNVAQEYLLSAIVMDTLNFTWRDTPLDTQWASLILTGKTGTPKEDLNLLCKPMFNAFEDGEISELSFSLKDVLFKDYKLYSMNDTFFYAISTLHTSFQDFIQKEFDGDSKAMVQCMQEVMKSTGVQLFSITLAVREKGSSTFYQQFGVFSSTVDVKALAKHVQDSGAELELIEEGEGYYLGMQNNPNVTRKQLQPYFQEFLKNNLQ